MTWTKTLTLTVLAIFLFFMVKEAFALPAVGEVLTKPVVMCDTPEQSVYVAWLLVKKDLSVKDAIAKVGKTKKGVDRCLGGMWRFVFVKDVATFIMNNREYITAMVYATGAVQGNRIRGFRTPLKQYATLAGDKLPEPPPDRKA